MLVAPSEVLWDVAARDESTKELTAKGGLYPYLADVTAPVRDEILLRYVHGLRFVAALHRTGGWPLVDRAWSAPPTTTEHNPPPAEVSRRRARRHRRRAASAGGAHFAVRLYAGRAGRADEVSLCLPRGDRERRGGRVGWRRVSCVAARGREARARVWALAWDDEAAATRFVSALTSAIGCWDAAIARDEGAKHARLGGPTYIARDGARVVVLRGVDEPAREAIVASALSGIASRAPAKPPLGAIR